MRTRRWLLIVSAVGLLASVLGLSACGGDDQSDQGAAKEKPSIAFMNASASNTYLSQIWKKIEAGAAERGATATQFDAAFDPAKQQQQLQAAVASGKYDGILIVPVSAALATDATAAAEAGLKVAVVGPSPLGTRMDTSEPQVEGVSFVVSDPPANWGKQMGEQTITACEGKDPCRVVYFYGNKGGPSDEGFFGAFEDTVTTKDSIEIVATPEGKYAGPDVALAAMQNVLQSHPDIDVVVGADQSMQGVEIALTQVDKLDEVAIIGLGGSEVALERIAAGKWFGGVMTAPQTEGKIAVEMMLDLLENGELSGPRGVNPLTQVPNEGVINQENIEEFTPEWKG